MTAHRDTKIHRRDIAADAPQPDDSSHPTA